MFNDNFLCWIAIALCVIGLCGWCGNGTADNGCNQIGTGCGNGCGNTTGCGGCCR
ncbi:MAG: hypothetical protein II557_01915 [Clostridia bacterium]|nr:hypothetical protein [Clostridia bacterium]MBQ4193961.1 hypothetical protein [Clostridia bacterium]